MKWKIDLIFVIMADSLKSLNEQIYYLTNKNINYEMGKNT